MMNLLDVSRLSAIVCGMLVVAQSYAGPADYVYTPMVEYREREIDIKYGNAKVPGGDRVQAASVGFGYGAAEHWFTEIYLKQERSAGQDQTLAEWENKFQLTESGKYPVDIGVITEIEAPVGNDLPWELKLGSLFQTEFAKFQFNGNVLLEHAFGKDEDSGVAYATNLGYQWQVKYRLQQEFEYGMQGYGEFGRWNDWSPGDAQSHVVGPAVFGKVRLGHRRALKYNIAWLIAASDAAPDHTFRTQVEYEY